MDTTVGAGPHAASTALVRIKEAKDGGRYDGGHTLVHGTSNVYKMKFLDSVRRPDTKLVWVVVIWRQATSLETGIPAAFSTTTEADLV